MKVKIPKHNKNQNLRLRLGRGKPRPFGGRYEFIKTEPTPKLDDLEQEKT